MKKLGLIGYPLSHSFSKKYFSNKFQKEKIHNFEYALYPLKTIESFPKLWAEIPSLHGLNVTIPYKEAVIPFLDRIDESANFGAVNTILKTSQGLIGYNTDVYGFEYSLKHMLRPIHNQALIFGTGGAAKAVAQVLSLLNIKWKMVSRQSDPSFLNYENLTKEIIENHLILINTTPLGMSPKEESYPLIPYAGIHSNHIVYDLVYNPEKTLFLRRAEKRGAQIKNGLEMLHLQAEKAWEIWTQSNV